ncbi:MAG: GNAT family N-acetyltransferase [Proteobacteria bacterium]|nr:GNAT family N-acetyltransferase [Pseudomonadota bacterium]
MITIKKPTMENLDYVSSLWTDEKTMKDVGGIHILEKTDYESFLKKNVDPVDKSRQYFIIFNDEEPVGEVSFSGYSKATNSAMLNIKIEYSKRRSHYAKDALKLFCDYYFNEFGGEILEDIVSNINGKKFLRKINFPYKEVKEVTDLSLFGQEAMKKYNIPLSDLTEGHSEYFILTKKDYKQNIQ